MARTASDKSIIHFDASQEKFFQDESRIQIVCWHRQKGKDFTAACKAVDGALKTGQTWFIVSLTQRQADETFAKCRQIADTFKRLFAAKSQAEGVVSESEFSARDEWGKSITWTAREIKFPNGGRVVSLPGRDPDTLAGLTGNLILTEFGLFPNGGYNHWSVLFPIITRGTFKIIVISTPRGLNTKFYELCNAADQYSVHFCDIYKSVMEEGYKLFDQKGRLCSIEEFRKMYGDESKWTREYECKFTGDLEALIKYAQLEAAGNAGRGLPFSFIRINNDNLAGATGGGYTPQFFQGQLLTAPGTRGRLELGWDVARTSHLSSLWVNHSILGKPKQLRFLVLMHNVSFALQRKIVSDAMDSGAGWAVGCGDSTGLGMESNEVLQAKYGINRWLPFSFAGKGKPELGSIGMSAYDGAGQIIPPIDGPYGFIASDLGAIQCDRSSGTLRLDEGGNPKLPESHCDIAYSNFLALKAGGLVSQTGGFVIL